MELQVLKNLGGLNAMMHFVGKYKPLADYEEVGTKLSKDKGWPEVINRREGEGEFLDMQDSFYHILDFDS